jgi:hypothetical protein
MLQSGIGRMGGLQIKHPTDSAFCRSQSRIAKTHVTKHFLYTERREGASGMLQSGTMGQLMTGRFWQPVLQQLIIVLTAALLSLPCLIYGIPPGHDAHTHVNYLYHFSRQFWNGEGYPRWLAEANKGYGTPIFFIQYPLPYWIAALLRPIVSFAPGADREARELGVFIFVALAAAGLAARLWFKKLASSPSATLAAVAYLSLPYILEQGIYARAAIGEICAFIWMPLALSLCESVHLESRAVFALGGVLALFFASNVLYAALFLPVLLVYALVSGKQVNRPFPVSLLWISLAVISGVGIAAVYVVPFVAYRQLFDLRQMPANLPGFELGRYFLYQTTQSLSVREIAIGVAGTACLVMAVAWDILRARANNYLRALMALSLGLGVLALIPNFGPTLIRWSGFNVESFDSLNYWSARMMVILFSTLIVGLIGYCRLGPFGGASRESVLLVTSCLAFIGMLPFSAPVWKVIPALGSIQFPYRLGGILTVAVAGLSAPIFDSCFGQTGKFGRPAAYVVTICAVTWVIVGGAFTWRLDWLMRTPGVVRYDLHSDVDLMYRTYVSPERLGLFAERMAATPGSYGATPKPGDGTLRAELTSGHCSVTAWRERPRELRVSANCQGDARLRIGQLYLPLWKIASAGRSSPELELSASSDGLIELPLSAGKQELRLILDRGAPERWGAIVSVGSMLLSVVAYMALSP